MREKYDPPKAEANRDNILQFLENQILFNKALIDARRNTPREKEQDTLDLLRLVEELKHMKYKASHIFYDPDPQDRPEPSARPARPRVAR